MRKTHQVPNLSSNISLISHSNNNIDNSKHGTISKL